MAARGAHTAPHSWGSTPLHSAVWFLPLGGWGGSLGTRSQDRKGAWGTSNLSRLVTQSPGQKVQGHPALGGSCCFTHLGSWGPSPTCLKRTECDYFCPAWGHLQVRRREHLEHPPLPPCRQDTGWPGPHWVPFPPNSNPPEGRCMSPAPLHA